MARTHGNDLVIVDANRNFKEVARSTQRESVRGVKFCMVEGYRDRLAIVGHDGYLSVFILRLSLGSVHLEQDISIFLEKNLWTVAWSAGKSRISQNVSGYYNICG